MTNFPSPYSEIQNDVAQMFGQGSRHSKHPACGDWFKGFSAGIKPKALNKFPISLSLSLF
jgi:hypothetical protein